MIYILVMVLMLQGEGSDPTQHVITTQWTSRSDCEDTEGVEATDAEKDPDVVGWYVLPASCEGIEAPKKD